VFEIAHRFENLNSKIFSTSPVESITSFQLGIMQMINDYLDYEFKEDIAIVIDSGYRPLKANQNISTGRAKNTSNHIYRLDLITEGKNKGKSLIRSASDFIPVYANNLNKVVDIYRAFTSLCKWYKGELYWNKIVFGKDGQGILHAGQNGEIVKTPWVTTLQGDISWKEYKHV
jgi:hypothetical protein